MPRRTSSRKLPLIRRRDGALPLWPFVTVAVVVSALFLGAVVWVVWPFWRYSGQFATHTARQPSRLYAAGEFLRPGERIDPEDLTQLLVEAGYRSAASRRPAVGEFHREDDRLFIHQRALPTPRGLQPEGILGIRLERGRVGGLWRDGRSIEWVALDPPLLNAYYGPDRQDRWPVRLGELPDYVVQAVLAAEDSGFFHHQGLSPSGIVRAFFKNLLSGQVEQGGSTLTQQLVKNLYLTPERTLGRKLREAAIAVLVDWRYDKEAILQAYLNEVYWGARDGVNLMGIGAAARAYFGRPATELTLSQAGVLAGMVRAPGEYLPHRDPERARVRRDWVVDRMVEEEWLSPDAAERVKRQPVRAVEMSPLRRVAPYFAAAARREAEQRFAVTDLAEGGFTLLSSLEPDAQAEAEAAVAWGVQALEEGWEKGHETEGPLQAALISARPWSGEIVAYVGGREFSRSQFDRVGQARRQAGSAFKPVVYLTALERGSVTPASLLDDAPLTVTRAGQRWSPENYDDRFRGWVTVRTALEESLNVPTARLALQTGLSAVVSTARRLGISAPLEPYPSIALGSFEVSALEMATVYATLANGGVRPTVHGLRGVLDRHGSPVAGEPLPEPQRAASPQSVYLVTSMLQGVLERGTGTTARVQGLTDPLAGKTGTSDRRRDSWFAGYAPRRVSVVWVGYDEGTPTRLSGARAALPIWARFMHAQRPPGGWPGFRRPEGIETALIDPLTGELATSACPEVRTELFRRGQVPEAVCHLHGGWFRQRAALQRGDQEDDERHPFRSWLQRVFGDDE